MPRSVESPIEKRGITNITIRRCLLFRRGPWPHTTARRAPKRLGGWPETMSKGADCLIFRGRRYWNGKGTLAAICLHSIFPQEKPGHFRAGNLTRARRTPCRGGKVKWLNCKQTINNLQWKYYRTDRKQGLSMVMLLQGQNTTNSNLQWKYYSK